LLISKKNIDLRQLQYTYDHDNYNQKLSFLKQ